MKKEDLAKLTRQELTDKIATGEIPMPMVFESLREGIITFDPDRFWGTPEELRYVGNGDEEPETTPEYRAWLENERRLIEEEKKAAAEASKNTKRGNK
ncbi:hypothetical protein QQ054_04890 [Oscillatoria amoena NRMC-F 0135]|nr:hypothetical protein [Oscillatoria amoena NRMC-F 0135]